MNFFKNLISRLVVLIGKVRWPSRTQITPDQKDAIKTLLAKQYFIILTYRKNELSSFLINIANLFLTHKWTHWSHVLMNLEDQASTSADFRIAEVNKKIDTTFDERRLIEATGNGTHTSSFDAVFNGVHAVALLQPKSMSGEAWTGVLDKALSEVGKPYDTLFNLADDKALSCVELIRDILMTIPSYGTDFANFEAMIKRYNNLTPSMFIQCPDFEIVYNTGR